jgi:hypothetical protein
MLHLCSPFWGFLHPHRGLFAGPGLLPSRPYPLACPEGMWGAWCCACAARFGNFAPHTGPFLQALDCSFSPYALACSGGMWDAWRCACTARFGDFAPHAGPILQGGGRPIPYPFGCLQLCLHSFFWFFISPCHRLGASPLTRSCVVHAAAAHGLLLIIQIPI